MRDECLFWEGKQNFRGFHDFRGFRVIDLAQNRLKFIIYAVYRQKVNLTKLS